jgi:hypothetical protein
VRGRTVQITHTRKEYLSISGVEAYTATCTGSGCGMSMGRAMPMPMGPMKMGRSMPMPMQAGWGGSMKMGGKMMRSSSTTTLSFSINPSSKATFNKSSAE